MNATPRTLSDLWHDDDVGAGELFVPVFPLNESRMEAETLRRNLAEALAIARALAKVATCMDNPAPGSIGTQVALLEALEKRVAGS